MKNILILLIASIALLSCEDKVDISDKLKSGTPALAVDAFLANLSENQVIKLNTSQYYFDNSGPKPANGAVVNVQDLTTQTVYPFTENGNGEYVSAIKGDSMLKIGHDYQLSIAYQGQNYVAYSRMNRVVPVDSITFEQGEDEVGNKLDDKFDAQLFASDAPGPGDRYWIRYYRNGKRETSAGKIGLAYDAGNGPNGLADNAVFILPLRLFIINEQEKDKKWANGETVKVELYSINNETAVFLSQVITQSTLGSGGAIGSLFSPPPANVPTNIKNVNENGSEAVGFFNTSAVSSAETTVPIPFGVKIP